MKKLLYLIALIPYLSLAQTDNLKIIYDVILNESSFQNTNSSQYNTLDFNAQNTNLIFEKSSQNSVCYLEFNAEEDIILQALISINNPVYFDFKRNKRLIANRNDMVIPDSKYLVEYPGKYIWDITTETKQIGNYTCYKAILQRIENSKDTFFPVTAWFCPELPINAGFSKYNGLPGMILELHENYISYMAQNVSFNTVSDISIPKLRIITLEKYLNELDKLKKENPQFFPKEVFN